MAYIITVRHALETALGELGKKPEGMTHEQIMNIEFRANYILNDRWMCRMLGIDYVNVPPEDEVKAYRYVLSQLSL